MKRTWQEYVKLAKHYKAIGQEEIWLSDDENAPWHLATQLSEGGLHRMGISVSTSFKGKDQKSGLTFRWSFDIEKREADGASKFIIDLSRIKRVQGLLPEVIAKKFAASLAETAKAIRKRGDEYSAIASEQYGMAYQLERL
jgi:hypothetical protein